MLKKPLTERQMILVMLIWGLACGDVSVIQKDLLFSIAIVIISIFLIIQFISQRKNEHVRKGVIIGCTAAIIAGDILPAVQIVRYLS